MYESGSACGVTVLAVHGYPDNHSVWDGAARLLGEHYRVLRYDVRGAGAPDQPTDRDAYRMPHLVDDLIAVLDATATDRVHLLGHDWGSIQCWAALEDTRLDGRIAGFTSVSGPSLAHAGVWLGPARGHRLDATRQLAKSYYAVLFQLPRLPELAVHAGLLDRAVALASSRRASSRRASSDDVAAQRSAADKLNGLQLYRANLRGGAQRPRPRRMDVPVQILVPRHDAFIRPEFAMQAPKPFVRNLHTRAIAGGTGWSASIPKPSPRTCAGSSNTSSTAHRCSSDSRRYSPTAISSAASSSSRWPSRCCRCGTERRHPVRPKAISLE